MKHVLTILLVVLYVTGCGEQHEVRKPSIQTESSREEEEMKMIVNVNGKDYLATLEENRAVDALIEMMEDGPITLSLSDYAGFEKVGPLGRSLPTSIMSSLLTDHIVSARSFSSFISCARYSYFSPPSS